MPSLEQRRAAALQALTSRPASEQRPAGRFSGETRPSGDLPETIREAEAYLAARAYAEDPDPSPEDPFADLSPHHGSAR